MSLKYIECSPLKTNHRPKVYFFAQSKMYSFNSSLKPSRSSEVIPLPRINAVRSQAISDYFRCSLTPKVFISHRIRSSRTQSFFDACSSPGKSSTYSLFILFICASCHQPMRSQTNFQSAFEISITIHPSMLYGFITSSVYF